MGKVPYEHKEGSCNENCITLHYCKEREELKSFFKADTKEMVVMVPLFYSPARMIPYGAYTKGGRASETYPNLAHSNGLKHATDGLYL